MLEPRKKAREHKRYAPLGDCLPRARHGRELDGNREKSRRPVGATPRRSADWQ